MGENVSHYESKLMLLLRKFGMDHLAWPLRRLYCPVNKEALVLEVGSGDSPYFRSNVLCDAYEQTEERYYTPLVCDRPTILAMVERLPFKDNAFDFVIASHVLEHSANPEIFLKELQRVSRAGYIEVPDAFMERLTHYPYHRLEITETGEELIIRKKKAYIEDPEIVSLFENKVQKYFPYWVSRFPFQFHVRYYWDKKLGGIKYRIVNPECDANWVIPEFPFDTQGKSNSIKSLVYKNTLNIIRKYFSQNKRNQSIDLLSLLKCPNCNSEKFNLDILNKNVQCIDCSETHVVFMSSNA